LAQAEAPVVLEVSRLLLVVVGTLLVALGEELTQVLVVRAVLALLDRVIMAALKIILVAVAAAEKVLWVVMQ
jgi:hypothetical protein